MIGRRGFCLVELLVALAIAVVLAAGLMAAAAPASSASAAHAAAIEMRQRLRAAAEDLSAALAVAGSGPVAGVQGQALGLLIPTLLPQRVGARADPPGSVRSDAITLVSSPPLAGSLSLTTDWYPTAGPAEAAPAGGCPVDSPTCGLAAGDTVAVIGAHGQFDLFGIDALTGTVLTLAPLGPTSGRMFPAGSPIVPVTLTTYYFKAGTPADGGQLMVTDGDHVDAPFLDHVVRFEVEWLAEPRPPGLRPGGPPLRATYGPSPPDLGIDDERDAWVAGENCTFAIVAGAHAPRLLPLAPTTGLVSLSPAGLSDGPWCPDAAAAWRYDADLLRVRAVRVTLVVEASSPASRGVEPWLFAHAGSSRDRGAPASDQSIVFDVVPRALSSGR